MSDPYFILLATSATLGIVHTAIGVDHVVPFVVLAHARKWSLTQTLSMTALCGVGHVLSSVLIASVGLGLGVATSRLEWIESTRGSWAAALLIGFGLAYTAVAFWKLRKRRLGEVSSEERVHDHGNQVAALFRRGRLDHARMMPALFIIFVLGPCEALLPLLTASGLTLSYFQAVSVGALYCGTTLLTMMTLVALGGGGLTASGLGRRQGLLHSHAHTLAGLSRALSGLAIRGLGI
jgi:hypothetical protein